MTKMSLPLAILAAILAALAGVSFSAQTERDVDAAVKTQVQSQALQRCQQSPFHRNVSEEV